MRRPTSLLGGVLLALLLVTGTACSDDDDGTDSGTDGTTDGPTTTVPSDPDLEPLLVQLDDLPEGFVPVPGAVDTVTTFCAGEDAAAGLQASGRALATYSLNPTGASVVHMVFRFDDDGAATFVEQAEQIFGRCDEVPDLTGLAYDYEPSSAAVEAVFGETDAHAVRHGTNVGSGALQEEIAVFHDGDIAHLVAVLSTGQSSVDLETLAITTFAAATGG